MLFSKQVLLDMGVSSSNADQYLAQLNAVMESNQINTKLRIAHFLAQVVHESGHLKRTEENLNYSAKRLLEVFPKYFNDEAQAKEYEKKPKKIGSRVYADRMGNGDESSEEGYRYRGRGLIQLTGKNNYKKFSDWIGEDIVETPDRVKSEFAAASAVFFWDHRNLNALADTDDLLAVTRKVNGGLNGYQDRLMLLESAKKALEKDASNLAITIEFNPTDKVDALALNLRSKPLVNKSTKIGLLRENDPVQVLGDSTKTNWVRVRAIVDGVLREGVVNKTFLTDLDGSEDLYEDLLLPETFIFPEAHLTTRRPENITRQRAGGRAHRLGEKNAPTRTGKTPATRVAAINKIIGYLDSENSSHGRYWPKGGNTYCNIYAHDYSTLSGVYLPRVWWKDEALAKIKANQGLKALYGVTVHEMNANSLYDWFRKYGPSFGWVPEVNLTTMQEAANLGQVCIIVAKRADIARSGHICAVAPETDSATAVRNRSGEVTLPVISQAGAKNIKQQAPKSQWWTKRSGSKDVYQGYSFWRHP